MNCPYIQVFIIRDVHIRKHQIASRMLVSGLYHTALFIVDDKGENYTCSAIVTSYAKSK
jgi:hypothetical protein